MGKGAETHVVPHSGGGWEVVRSGAAKRDSLHRTQHEAERRARELVSESGGGEVILHGKDGRIRQSDTLNGDKSSRRAPSRSE